MKLKAACSIVVLVALLLNLTGCAVTTSSSTPTSNSTPLLPEGFTDATVPDVTLGGYVYLNQSTPIVVTPDFVSIGLDKVSVDSAQLWGGSDTDSFGGAVDFSSQDDAARVVQLIKSAQLPVWTMNNGKVIYAVNSTAGDWNAALQNSLSQQQMVSIATGYPEVYADFTSFPANPPLKPFAAGFIDLNSTLAESISTEFNMSLTVYLAALKTAGISRVCFVGYDAQTIAVSSKSLTKDYLNSLQLSALALLRSTYPDVAIALAFDKAMTDAGLTKSTVDNVDIYSYSQDGINVLVAHKGSIIYAAVSQSEETAQNLLLSCF